ncbi:ABC transporter ATP-binding protein [Sandaracinobacter neustonicus]|uniref:ABC transporter ATP-binding protein n=1 Tax=Sandaracinobacter neustonicus TaxID=1715348 RepID=A0A501XL35_9SPHN|nr:ABC transporter ATP-binding protein [Sandaracinobacter neustonicus]TPE61003.1 ABC transporter ATP-binding protein [Sandaracinobacter neustonicus]
MTLEISGLSLSRGGRPVLRDVSAAFAPGSVSVILGPNGAGKSTLLDAMAGLRAADAGTVRLNGVALADMPHRERARRIGYLPQGGEVHWNLRVHELVALGRLPHRGAFAGESGADRAAIARAMAAADVAALADRPVLALSGGERARVLLARVLAGEPELLLADEPLANLDPRHAVDALRLFRRAADAGAAVVLVLHDLQAAARAADQLLLLADGHCLAQGDPAEVLTPALLAEAYGLEMLVRQDAEAGLIVAPKVV